MVQKSKPKFYEKLFARILRIRDYEIRKDPNSLIGLKYTFYIYRDMVRVILSLYAAKLFLRNESRITEFLSSCYKNRHLAYGQQFQDILAYFVSPKSNGFFVEFGATDGCFLSNTYFLEKQYSWNGILAEPAKSWAKQLKANRGTCSLDFRCVWSRTGERIEFSEDVLPEISGALTTLDKSRMSSNSSSYLVNTVSLNDLLDEYNAPEYVDFMSIDTEGSEFEILEHFDFDRYRFGLIIVEHNYEVEKQQKLLTLFVNNSYKCILQDLSGQDYWFVPSKVDKESNDQKQP
jgi:FkbM family methyltransferase